MYVFDNDDNSVLTFFFFANEIRHSFGRLTVIREHPSHAKRELTSLRTMVPLLYGTRRIILKIDLDT
jgi:hypothetical protein